MIYACRVSEKVALAADKLTTTPVVKGLSYEERNQAIVELNKLCPIYVAAKQKNNSSSNGVQTKTLEKQEMLLEQGLLKLGWRHEAAAWSSEWWKCEEAWIAPWLDNMGKLASCI